MSELSNDQTIQDYANKICLHSKAGLNCIASLLRDLPENGDEDSSSSDMSTFKSFEVLLEFLCLYLHITSRWTSSELPVDKADELYDTLSTKCINASVEYGLFGYPEDTKKEIRLKAFGIFRDVDEEYSKYVKLVPEDNEGSKNTLIWEFGKSIAAISGIKNVMACQHACLSLITHALGKLDPRQFVTKVR